MLSMFRQTAPAASSRAVQKAFGDLIVFCLPVLHRPDGPLPQQQYLPLGVGHQQGGVGGDDQLGAGLHQPVNFRQQGQLPGGGEGLPRARPAGRCLAPKPVVHQAEEALPVGLVVQGLAAVALVEAVPGLVVGQPVHLAGDVVEALRPQEKAVLGAVGAPVQPQVVVQPGVGVPGGKGEVPGAPLGVESQGQGHGLQQSGLAAAVFPHQKGDRLVQLQQAQPSNGGDALQIGVLPAKLPPVRSMALRYILSLLVKKALQTGVLFLCIEVCGPQQFARGGTQKEALRFHRTPNACRPVCLSHRVIAPLGACATCLRGPPKRSLMVSPRSKRVPPRVSISPGFRAPRRVRDLPAGASQKKPYGFIALQTRAAPCVYLTRLSRPLGAYAT